jgi:fucose 4-O-acetylase-like acetyltransferase
MAAVAQASQKNILWIAHVKGVAIFLVVLLHFSDWLAKNQESVFPAIFYASDYLRAFRMPAFFLVSGMLGKGTILRGGEKFNARVKNLFFLYVFWTVALNLRLLLTSDGRESLHIGSFIWSSVLPSGYWYLWALPAYYLLSRMISRTTLRWKLFMLALAAGVSCYSGQLAVLALSVSPDVLDGPFYADVLRNLVWFMVGFLWKDEIIQAIEGAGKPRKYFLLYLSFFISAVFISNDRFSGLSFLILSASMCVFGLLLFSLIEHMRFMKFFEWIGKSTIEIYIFHFYFLSAFSLLSRQVDYYGIFGWTIDIMPLFIALVVVVGCRKIAELLRALGLEVLLSGPFQSGAVGALRPAAPK